MAESNDSPWPTGAPSVGETAEHSRTVERKEFERFTESSGDRNPLHFDEATARATQFGEFVVQGGVTSAILDAVVAEELPDPGTVFLKANRDFTPPVRPGDTLTGSVEVLDVREDKPITELATTVIRDDGETALDGTAVCYTMDIGNTESK